jgi:hypothetical protein
MKLETSKQISEEFLKKKFKIQDEFEVQKN